MKIITNSITYKTFTETYHASETIINCTNFRDFVMNRKMYENLIFGVKYEKYRFIFG